MGQNDVNKQGQGAKATANRTTLSKEVATDHVKGLTNYYRVKVDEMGGEREQKAIEAAIKVLVTSTMAGDIRIDESNWDIIHMLVTGGQVTYHEFTAKAKVAMGKRSDTDIHGRVYELLGSVSGLGVTPILNDKKKDIEIAEAIAAVFLA